MHVFENIKLPESGKIFSFRKPTGMDERTLIESAPEEFRMPLKVYEALAYTCLVSFDGNTELDPHWKKRVDLFEELKDKQFYENLFVEMFTLSRDDMNGIQAQAKNLLASSRKAD